MEEKSIVEEYKERQEKERRLQQPIMKPNPDKMGVRAVFHDAKALFSARVANVHVSNKGYENKQSGKAKSSIGAIIKKMR